MFVIFGIAVIVVVFLFIYALANGIGGLIGALLLFLLAVLLVGLSYVEYRRGIDRQ